jgi:hypothetical protein
LSWFPLVVAVQRRGGDACHEKRIDGVTAKAAIPVDLAVVIFEDTARFGCRYFVTFAVALEVLVTVW